MPARPDRAEQTPMNQSEAPVAPDAADLRLPAGSTLLHIGPQKTGSTAIQAAFHARRADLAEHGVAYPGDAAKPVRAFQAGLGFGMGRGGVPPRKAAWRSFRREIEEAADLRVLVSLESMGRLRDERLDRVVTELGGAQPHVVAVARRYDRLLPSQWQQRLKAGERRSYDAWLRRVLDPEPSGVGHPDSHSLWLPHHTAHLVRRWADRVGADNVTVVIAREGDRQRVLTAFESLLGLPHGFLPTVENAANRSLSLQEAELLRAGNEAFASIPKATDRDWHTLISRGLVPALVKRPLPEGHDPLPPLPDWARELVEELSDQRIDELPRLGVRLVGDLDDLRLPAVSASVDRGPDPDTVTIETAVQALEGIAAGAVRGRLAADRRQAAASTSQASGDPVPSGSRPSTVRRIKRRARAVLRRLR